MMMAQQEIIIRDINRHKLQTLVVEATAGCCVQHDGWPCNTCFHYLGTYFHDLPGDIHDYWLAVLAFRGDYDDIPRRDDRLEVLIQFLEKVKQQGRMP